MKVTPEKVVAIYKEHGETISLEQARLIIEFLRMLAQIELNAIFGYEDSRPIYQSEHGRAG